MGLLDGDSEEPKSKLRRYVVTGLILAIFLALGIGYLLRYYTEKKTVEQFLTALAAGNTEEAYRTWKAQASYTYQDFLQDWGPQGYYGPVKSFRVEAAEKLKGASGVIVVVAVSPYGKFPDEKDAEKNRYTKEVRIWVERRDQSLSFPP
jgi:hypothetical protein